LTESEPPVYEPRIVKHEVREIPLVPEASSVDDALYIVERPIETVARRLNELQLSTDDFARVLNESSEDIQDMLDEEIPVADHLLYTMFDVVGIELVAVRSPSHPHKDDQGGHWCHGERCVYCGVNYYDADLDPDYPLCPNSPFNKKKAGN
jgi:hypothetical protein